MDYQFGLLLHALKESGVYDKTAIIFFSDHGDFSGDFGLAEKAQNLLYDSLTRVPLIIKSPKSAPKEAGVRRQLVELVDIPATVFELAGIVPGYRHFGRSLVPLLIDKRAEHRDAVFTEGGRLPRKTEAMEKESIEGKANPLASLWPRLSVQYEDDVAHGRAVMCRTKRLKHVYRLLEEDELYDLNRDPNETRNLIRDPKLSPTVKRPRSRLLGFMVETSDVVFKSNERGLASQAASY